MGERGLQPGPVGEGFADQIRHGLQHSVIKGKREVTSVDGGICVEKERNFRETEAIPENTCLHLGVFEFRKPIEDIMDLFYSLQ